MAEKKKAKKIHEKTATALSSALKKITKLEGKKSVLDEEASRLAKERAELAAKMTEVDSRLSAIEKESGQIPALVKEIALGILTPIVEKFGFSPQDLILKKPTPTDPVIEYRGKTILWYLET